jgi:SPP1 family predicted phage head-tail adaptor
MKTCKEFLGLAKHQIIIEEFTPTPDDYGGTSVSWGTLLTVWAIVEPLSGREVFEFERLQSQVNYKFTIRFESTLTDTQDVGKHRINYDSRVFDIKHIRNIYEKDNFMEIFAQEGSGT